MELLSIKEELHKNYIRTKGRFTIDCNILIFSTEEIGIIQKWGHWFKALCDEELSPFTEKQRHFKKVMLGEEEPFTVAEQAWHTYLGRKKIEEKYGDHLNYNYIPEEEGFYSRDMLKASST